MIFCVFSRPLVGQGSVWRGVDWEMSRKRLLAARLMHLGRETDLFLGFFGLGGGGG